MLSTYIWLHEHLYLNDRSYVSEEGLIADIVQDSLTSKKRTTSMPVIKGELIVSLD